MDRSNSYKVADNLKGFSNDDTTTDAGELNKDENGSQSCTQEEVHLKREMGLWSGVSLIVGVIIGSGIFISPKGIAIGSGSVGFALVNWAICGLISFLGALCVAELGSMISKNGGDYMYLKEGLGNLPAYAYAQIVIFLLGPASAAIQAITCSIYIMLLFFDDNCGDTSKILNILLAAVILILLTIINIRSVALAARIQVIFTIGKVAVLIVIIVGGIVKLVEGNTQHLETGFEGTESNIGKIAIGLYNGMFAYGGANNLNTLAGELKNPARNIPLSILIAMPLVTVIYILANISYFTVMSIEELIESSAVAVTWADRVLGPAAWIIPVGVAMSTFGSLNGGFLASGRIGYSTSREGHTVEVLSMVHIKYYTPLTSILLLTILSIILAIPSDVASLLDLFNLVSSMFSALIMVSLIIMRKTKKDVKREFKVPLVLPVLMIFVYAFLGLAPFIEEVKVEYLYSIAILVFFTLFYYPFIYKRYRLPGIDTFTKWVQLLLQVAPPTSKDN